MNEYDDLLRGCAEGDVEATQQLDSLVAAVAAPVVRKLRVDGFSKSDIDDVMRGVWLKVYTPIRTNTGKAPVGYALKSWIETIAFRECINSLRRRRLEKKHFRSLEFNSGTAEQIDPGAIHEKLEKIDVARKILESFGGEERHILEGVILGLTNDELCAKTGFPLGTLKHKKARVLAEARRRAQAIWERGTDESDQ